MNWLQKIAKRVSTEQLPQLLTDAIQYECGGQWELGPVKQWTRELEDITGHMQLGREKGYSTSFWISCKTGDGVFGQKWGVSVNFTVTSGSSVTTFDKVTGDCDLDISANVQWASPKSWTPTSPYPLLIRLAGSQDDMRTISEVANFVKNAILSDQSESGDDGNDDNDDPDMFPDWPYAEEEVDEDVMAILPGQVRGRAR